MSTEATATSTLIEEEANLPLPPRSWGTIPLFQREKTGTKVLQAISAVSSDLAKDGIAKDGKNAQQGYRFRGIDQVYGAMAPLLAKHQLVIVPRIRNRTVSKEPTRNSGVLFYVVVEGTYDVYSAEDGSRLEPSPCLFGEAMDSGDKATNKAMSAAYKYLCFQLFCIPTEGDNDADATTHAEIVNKATGEVRAAPTRVPAGAGAGARGARPAPAAGKPATPTPRAQPAAPEKPREDVALPLYADEGVEHSDNDIVTFMGVAVDRKTWDGFDSWKKYKVFDGKYPEKLEQARAKGDALLEHTWDSAADGPRGGGRCRRMLNRVEWEAGRDAAPSFEGKRCARTLYELLLRTQDAAVDAQMFPGGGGEPEGEDPELAPSFRDGEGDQ